MAILKYTTSVESEKSISEIQKILAKHGAQKISTDYKDGIPVALTFSLPMNGIIISFALPANAKGVLRAMERDKNVIYKENVYPRTGSKSCVENSKILDRISARLDRV